MGNQERVRGRRLSGVLLALALATLVSFLVVFPSRDASALSPSKADYRFQGKRSSSVGNAPALQDIGPKNNSFTTATVDGASRKVLSYPRGNGLKLDTTGLLSSNGIYTIVVLFELNDVSNFKRVIDFKNGTSDSGLYVQNGGLRFFPHSSTGPTPIAANQYVQVVITRDLSGTVKGYVDGTKQFSFEDAASQDAVLSGEDTLRFFKDNTSGGTAGEESAGSVARIRLFDTALSDDALSDDYVGRLDRLEPTVFKVNSNADLADSNTADGKCLTVNPNECTLRAAVEQSNKTAGDDTINFASMPSGTITLTGGEISIRNEPDSLIINGPGARVLTVSGNKTSRVFRLSDDASAAINNLTISNGNATSASPNGGGISTDGDLLALTNVTVSDNQATSGGGIYNSGNVLTLNNSTVGGDNKATNGVGGGIYNINGAELTLKNSTVSGNQATSGLDPSFGGGIANGGTLTLNNSTISGNQVNNGDGGGIYNTRITSGGTMTLTNSTVSGNSVTLNGGGIFNNGGDMTLVNSTIASNTAGQSGGGLVNNLVNDHATAILLNTIAANNTAATTRSDATGSGAFSSQGNNLVESTSGASGFGGSDVLGKDPRLGPLDNNGGPTDTHALLSRSPAIDSAPNANCPSKDQRGVSRPRDGDGNGKSRCDIGAYEKK